MLGPDMWMSLRNTDRFWSFAAPFAAWPLVTLRHPKAVAAIAPPKKALRVSGALHGMFLLVMA